MKSLILFCSVFLFSTTSLWSQRTVSGLRDSLVQQSFFDYTKKYDSLVFYDVANFRSDDMMIKGFAFKGKKVYSASFTFEKVNEPTFTVKIIAFNTKRFKDKSAIKSLKSSNLGAIKMMNLDSLQIKSAPGTSVNDIADGSLFTLLFIDVKNQKIFVKQCDQPIDYQKIYATKDRGNFISIYLKMKEILSDLN